MAVKNLDRRNFENFKKYTIYQVLIITFLFPLTSFALSFSKGKSTLEKNVYAYKGETFYCGCLFQKKSIKTKTCKILTKKFKKRKTRLEWEHIVPAHAFGQSFIEWRDYKKFCPKTKSPRKCARKKNKLFKEMEGNIFNLVPSVGAVNAVRSNYSFSELGTKSRELCKNGLRILKRKVMPPLSKKGDIARVYFYMNSKYPGRGIISSKNKKLFEAWNKIDPVDKEECRINVLKSRAQKEINPFVSKFCKGSV